MPEDIGYSNTELRTVWIDATHKLIRSPGDICRFYGDPEFAIFKHPERDCIYSEAEACINLKKDDPEIIKEQVGKYKVSGFPSHAGLYVSWLIYRRYTQAVRDLCVRWWSELEKGSRRDQLSLPFALSKSTVKPTELRGRWFEYSPHKRQFLV